MEYDNNNVFAKILRKEIPTKFIYEDDYAVAFDDIAPSAPIHVLVIPKVKRVSFDDFIKHESVETVGNFFKAVRKVVDLLPLSNGYKVATNIGKDGGQTVFHYHVHIIGGHDVDNVIPG